MAVRRAIRRAAATVACAVLALALGACSSSSPVGVPPGASLVPSSRVDTLADETDSGLEERRRLVVRSDSAWADLWQRIYETREPRPEVPDVDFDEHVVIAVAMGERRTGGFTIGIERVYRDDGELHVVVRETSPGSECGVTLALTQPVLAVRVPAVPGPVSFHERTSVSDCS